MITKKIKKWVNCISGGWQDRNVYIDGALFSYSKENKDGKEEMRRCALWAYVHLNKRMII